jgi:Uma2 family endonuclease
MDTFILPPRTIMEEYKSLPEGTLAQLIENELIMSPAPLEKHQSILMEISAEMFQFVKKHQMGVVRVAPYDVYLDRKNVFQPDLIFVSKANLHLIEADGLHGSPDLVAEILSPFTAKYDLQVKKDVYERCGVQEYWLVDPADNAAIGYKLEAGSYVEFARAIGALQSELLGITIRF